MIKVHLETDSLKAPAEAIHRALRKTVYALNKKIKREQKMKFITLLILSAHGCLKDLDRPQNLSQKTF